MKGISSMLFLCYVLFMGCLIASNAANQYGDIGEKCSVFNNSLSCSELENGDLPLPDGAFPKKIYDSIGIYVSPNLTNLPSFSFGQGIIGKKVELLHSGIATFESDFLGDEEMAQHVISMEIIDIPAESFPWIYLESFTSLKEFAYRDGSLKSIDADVPWSPTVEVIFMQRNPQITSIGSNAFKQATNLRQLNLWDMGPEVEINENAFRISTQNKPILRYNGEGCSASMIAENAFGNVVGGQLWGSISIDWCDFPELTFRLMLKTAFDKGLHELIEPMWPDGPQRIEVGDCDCSIAWLYKDAHKYGLTQYQDLLGDSGNNIICDSVGAILLAEDPEFISLMDSCPETPMPWGENYCIDHSSSGATTDTTEDPNDCHCYYHCTSQDTIAGHECCPPGLAYNPAIEICDWADNVPNCDP